MKSPLTKRGFTLLELLVVIAIIGIVAGLSVPAIKSFGKTNAVAAATRQMLDDVARARQLAISQRTLVYMVFVPTNFWLQPVYNSLPQSEKDKAARLFDKQLTAYTFVAMRSVGDQPGRYTPRYLSPWRTLPEGTFIAQNKFGFRPPANPAPVIRVVDPGSGRAFNILGFSQTNSIPFPSEQAQTPTFVTLPYIAFDPSGRLLSGVDEFIPLATGAVQFSRDSAKVATAVAPSVSEKPAGNSTNSFNLVHIDWLTGRARIESPQIQ